MFPQELINRFIDEVSTARKPSYYLPPTTRNDLQSCSLAARCFRLQSQRHLLAHAEFFIIRGETQSKRVLKLREILESNEDLRHCVIYVTIRLRAADPLNANSNDGVGDARWKFHDENLPTVINMLAEMRHLNIRWEHLNVVEWDRLSEGIRTALRNTPSPHLSVLGLHRVSISPYYLVDTWKSIKEITLRCVEMVQMNIGEEGKESAPSIPECRLERVNISGLEFPLHHALNDRILGGLRHFRVELYRFCPYSIRQIWNVIHITSKSLESLDLAQCFITCIRPPFITMDHFPSLQSLAISDDIIGPKAFLDTVVPFFKLENPMSTSKLENLTVNLKWIMPIGSNSSYEDDVLLPSNGWHQLDALLTSSHYYPSLRKVTIGICLSASWDWRLGEPERHARLWGIYRTLQSSCFPLVSCSDSIEFVFHPSTGYHTGF